MAAANVEVDSILEKWNELPMELKLECIKTMDFKMKFALRGASSTERTLVDQERFQFSSIDLSDGSLKMTATEDGKTDVVRLRSNTAKIIPLLGYIQEKCDIEKFTVRHNLEYEEKRKGPIVKPFPVEWMDKKFLKELDSTIEPQSLHVKHLDFDGGSVDNTSFFLKKCWNGIEKLGFYQMDWEVQPVKEFFGIPAVVHAMRVHIGDVLGWPDETFVLPLIQNWILHDVKIGTQLQLQCEDRHFIYDFANTFKDRVVYLQDADYEKLTLVIKTNDPGKHILMSVLDGEEDEDDFCCVVIPAELEKSQHAKHLEDVRCDTEY